MSWVTFPACHSTRTYFRRLRLSKAVFKLIQGSEHPQGFGLNGSKWRMVLSHLSLLSLGNIPNTGKNPDWKVSSSNPMSLREPGFGSGWLQWHRQSRCTITHVWWYLWVTLPASLHRIRSLECLYVLVKASLCSVCNSHLLLTDEG